MSRIFISEDAGKELVSWLEDSGHTVETVRRDPAFGRGIESHADLRVITARGRIFCADRARIVPKYPENAAYCGVFLEKYFVHRLDITAPEVLEFAEKSGFVPVNVRQGYTKCSTVVVDGKSVITSDDGVAETLKSLGDVDVIKVRPGFVKLRDFPYGFIGGASGRVGDTLVFNGDITAHPDHEKIRAFVDVRGVRVKSFDYELEDIGSVIEYGGERDI